MPSPFAVVEKDLVGHGFQVGLGAGVPARGGDVPLAQYQFAQRYVLRNGLAGAHDIADQHRKLAGNGWIAALFPDQVLIDVGASESHSDAPC
jgi:hypothetical protein